MLRITQKLVVLCLPVAACSAEVQVVEDGKGAGLDASKGSTSGQDTGAGGTGGKGGSSTGGTPNEGGSGGNGGSDGGGAPLPVAGCERLLEDEPFMIPGADTGFVAGVDSSYMGFVGGFLGSEAGSEIRSARLAFGPWPPPMTEQIAHALDVLSDATPPLLVREDGTFGVHALFSQSHVLGSFYEPGLFPAADQAPILEPPPGTGYYSDSGQTLRYYSTVEAVFPAATVSLGAELNAFGNNGSGDLVLLVGDAFFGVQSGEVEPIGSAPPLTGTKAFGIVPRSDGFWFGALSQVSASPAEMTPVEIAAVDDSGVASPPYRPFGDATNIWLVRMTRWHEGVALVAQRTYPDWGFIVAVTDGAGTTTLTREDSQEDGVCGTAAPSIVTSPDGDSIYVGHVLCGEGYKLRRFHCGGD